MFLTGSQINNKQLVLDKLTGIRSLSNPIEKNPTFNTIKWTVHFFAYFAQ